MMGSALERVAHGAMLVVVVSACYAEGVSTPTPARDLTAVGSIADTSAWRDAHPHTMAELLRDRFPGVEVTSVAGGGVSVRMRGSSSLVLGTEPLYVVDGMPAIVGPDGALAELNPDDVQRVEVLRGAAASAMWGNRGANGVILITTRRR